MWGKDFCECELEPRNIAKNCIPRLVNLPPGQNFISLKCGDSIITGFTKDFCNQYRLMVWWSSVSIYSEPKSMPTENKCIALNKDLERVFLLDDSDYSMNISTFAETTLCVTVCINNFTEITLQNDKLELMRDFEII